MGNGFFERLPRVNGDRSRGGLMCMRHWIWGLWDYGLWNMGMGICVAGFWFCKAEEINGRRSPSHGSGEMVVGVVGLHRSWALAGSGGWWMVRRPPSKEIDQSQPIGQFQLTRVKKVPDLT